MRDSGLAFPAVEDAAARFLPVPGRAAFALPFSLLAFERKEQLKRTRELLPAGSGRAGFLQLL